jgi:hypothetical protein
MVWKQTGPFGGGFERLVSMERGNPHATPDAVLKMVDLL